MQHDHYAGCVKKRAAYLFRTKVECWNSCHVPWAIIRLLSTDFTPCIICMASTLSDSDVPLTEKGEGEARAAGQALRRERFEFDIAFSSLLKRCGRDERVEASHNDERTQ